MEKHTPQETITDEQLKAMEELFRPNLPESPINLDEYKRLCKQDEIAEELLNSMIEKSIDYTVDVSNMERYVREHPSEKDEDREAVDRKRTITHNATMDSINIFCRYLNRKFNKESFIKWDKENRGAYGRFAILLALNMFKEKIILDLVKEKSHGEEIDISKLKKSAVGQELLVLDYVDILCVAEKEDRQIKEDEEIKLKQIEEELNQAPDNILSAFHEIYIKRY